VLDEIWCNVFIGSSSEVSLEVKSEAEVELLESQKEESTEKKEECCEKWEKCRKARKRFCRNACACFGVFTSITMLIYFVIVASVMIRVGTDLKQCLHSKENIYKESSIVDANIKQINLNIVSGFVHVDFEDRPDIFIRVWDNARASSYVLSDTFDSGVAINNSSVLIHSISPAFNFRSCFHAKVEIIIPNSYQHSLSINGNVKLGMVKIEGNGNKLAGIDINVELGKIVVKGVVVSNSLSLTSEIGYIKVKDVDSRKDTKIQSHTGIVRTVDVKAKNFVSSTQFGCSKHYNLNAEVAKLDTRFGFQFVDRISPIDKELDVQVNTEYGKSFVVLDSSNIDFTLGTTKGQMTVEYEDEDWICKVDKSSHILMNGKCNVLSTKKEKNVVKLAVNTKYGSSKVVVDRIEEDDE